MNYWMTVVALFSRCGEKERVRFPFLRTLRRERGGGGNGERFDYGGGGTSGLDKECFSFPFFLFSEAARPLPKLW